MNNLTEDINKKLKEIITDLEKNKKEYEKIIKENNKEINKVLKQVKKYKDDFYISRETINKMNKDIEGFEKDYQNLVEKFKDDELSNILIAANKEISAKIDERKSKILKDQEIMNSLVKKAEEEKKTLIKLSAEKKALEICLDKITDTYNFYSKTLNEIIDYSKTHKDNLSSYFGETIETIDEENIKEERIHKDPIEEKIEKVKSNLKEESSNFDEKFDLENIIDDSLPE